MVDVVQTAANVNSVRNARTRTKTAAEAITAGDAVYEDATGQIRPAQHDVDILTASAVGIALNDAAAGQPVTYQAGGDIDVGGALAVGEVYVVSANPGAIAQVGDVGVGDFMTILGVAIAAGELKMGILQAGVATA